MSLPVCMGTCIYMTSVNMHISCIMSVHVCVRVYRACKQIANACLPARMQARALERERERVCVCACLCVCVCSLQWLRM